MGDRVSDRSAQARQMGADDMSPNDELEILLPDLDSLDAVATLIGGSLTRFTDIGPEARVQVLTLAIAAQRNAILSNIDAGFTNVDARLSDIDARLSHVSIWFEKSRLYEP